MGFIIVDGKRVKVGMFLRMGYKFRSWLIRKLGAQRFKYTAELPIACDFSETGLEWAIDMMEEKWGSRPSFVLVQSLKLSMDELNWIKEVADKYGVHYEVTSRLPDDAWMLFDENSNCVYSKGAC